MNITFKDVDFVSIQELLCTQFHLSERQQIYISVFNIVAAIIAVLGNLIVNMALNKVSVLHPPSKLLLRSLASADLCIGLTAQPLYFAFLMYQKQNSEVCYYVLNLFTITTLIFGGVSKFTLVAISVDRLLALILKLSYRQVVTFKRALGIVVTFWFASAATALTVLKNVRIGIVITEIGLVVCVIISTICYSKIYHALRQNQARIHFHANQGRLNIAENALDTTQYKKTVCNSQWVQVAYLTCSLPYGTVAAFFAIGGSLTPSLYVAWNVTFLVLLLNSALNPFLYFWKIREVRKAMKETIMQLFAFLR